MSALPLRDFGIFALGVALLSACGHECDGALEWSIVASTHDAATGNEICEASGVVRDGEYLEEMTCFGPPSCSCNAVSERLGTYQVTISAPGYQPSTKTVVIDDSDECHVETEHPDFKLTPL